METLTCNSNGICGVASAEQISPDIKSNQLEIIYGYDPLCGWCYGFSPQLEKIRKEFAGKIRFRLVNGGIFSGERKVQIRNISAHIHRNMPYVTKVSGVEFGKAFLELLQNDSYSYDSEKSSVAVTVFRELRPEFEFDFAAGIQKAFFLDGKDVNDDATFAELIKPYQIDADIFFAKLHSPEYHNKTFQEFADASNYNLSYPSLILITPEGEEFLNIGFEQAANVIRRISHKLEKINHLSTHEPNTYI